ncbi:sirohydrochlorin cobaltochelatase [Desulfobotulus sp. H1]|uniref:Sirohydrochlorin cobaltochelatase n=1 Tax=Desulfobotulus pelophilus TaxID=2823377 RepID=A0ABT3NBU8_9BACT|nr:sirohydrochlorin cobaltochelatase [Desulfobotulus pelophilus]MCW7754945.1 sirohydrochlorin cobaltochelatase [Desulfobotulus pelophilus]
MSRTPVILTAFGTRNKTKETTDFIENYFRKTFPSCEFHWAFSARSVQKNRHQGTPPPPEKVLQELADQGHSGAVIQSLHVVCAAEFHKLIPLCRNAPLATQLSLPLLASVEDCRAAACALKPAVESLASDTAAVLALHGSSHPGGTLFHLMGRIFMETCGDRAFFGMIEGEPGKEAIARRIGKAGFTKAHIFPFTLITGIHVEKDLAGPEDSWKTAFLAAGITPAIDCRSLGRHPAILDIFGSHLRKTLDATMGTGPTPQEFP